MMYDQLVRVNQIDDQISDLHRQLGTLYQERQAIIEPTATSKTTDLARASYDDLVIAWQHRGLRLPSYQSLRTQLTKAHQVMQNLQQLLPELAGDLCILVVPPHAQLQKVLATAHQNGAAPAVRFSDLELADSYKQSRNWQLFVVIEAGQTVPGNNLAQLLADQGYKHQGYDGRGLGLQGLLAYGLQTGNWPSGQAWQLLLADGDSEHVLCALQYEGQLLVDRDQSNCLIGANFFKPAIVIEKGR